MEQKRRTRTSTAVKNKYNNSHYKRFLINMRYDSDADIINFLENSASPSEVVRQGVRMFMKTKSSAE